MLAKSKQVPSLKAMCPKHSMLGRRSGTCGGCQRATRDVQVQQLADAVAKAVVTHVR